MEKQAPRTSDEMIADAKAALGMNRNRPLVTPAYPNVVPPSYPTIAPPSYPEIATPSYAAVIAPSYPTIGAPPHPVANGPAPVEKQITPMPQVTPRPIGPVLEGPGRVRQPAPAPAGAAVRRRPTADRPTPQQTARVIVRSLAVGWFLLVLLGIVVRLLANLG